MGIKLENLNIEYNRHLFYLSPEWRNLRELKLSMNPICERCIKIDRITPAKEVHHKIDITEDPFKALDINNLESLCKRCHSTHTMKETRKKQKQNKGHIKRIFDIGKII
jgi:5-methylcytosine-specific restriction protein A